MGKKKSVVLLTLITVVLVVLCALSIVPTFSFPWGDGVNGWKSAIGHLHMSADFEGGYYAYYYPEGVISETEYQSNLENYPEEEKADYEKQYVKSNGLYLAKDEKYGIFDDEDISWRKAPACLGEGAGRRTGRILLLLWSTGGQDS